MSYYSQYWDAYYRSEGDSVDSGISHFNYCGGSGVAGDSDVVITAVTGTLAPETFTGVASASFSEIGSETSQAPAIS